MFRERQIQMPTTGISAFYHACSMSDIPRVKSYLNKMTLNEINRIESNGNTALHIAAFYHNVGVVYLLLKRGAISSIKNRYNLIPFEETTSSYIKQLLSNKDNMTWIEWTFIDPPTREMKHNFDTIMESTFQKMGLTYILDYLLSHYLRRHIAKAFPMSVQEIEMHLIDARKSISLFPVIRAYTSPFNFDQIINRHCIQILPNLLKNSVDPRNTLSSSIFYLISALSFDPMLRPKYNFIGRVYRGLTMNANYIRTFKRNELVVNRIFILTYRRIEIANRFVGFNQSNEFRPIESRNFLQAAVRITYQIHRPETRAINITNMSIYSTNNEEILLMPISAFRVVDIRSEPNGLHFDVTLEDCELPVKDDPVAPIIRCDFAEFPDRSIILPTVQPSNRSAKNTIPRRQNRLTTAMSKISTRRIIIVLIIITLLIILIILAILLPIVLRRSCDRNENII